MRVKRWGKKNKIERAKIDRKGEKGEAKDETLCVVKRNKKNV